MQRNSARILLAIILAAAALAYSAHAQSTERRLEQYGCVLRLPDSDFTWLTKEDMPGATLACRDSKARFVILIVMQAPPGYYIDARQGAAFESGMLRKSDQIERLSGKLTSFLGVTCYEMRGRLKADQSLTLTRMFAANGFMYNLQAMIPPTPDGRAGNFEDLFAAFQFIHPTPVPSAGGTPPRTPVPRQATSAPIAPTADGNEDVQASPEVQPPTNASPNPPSQAPLEDELPRSSRSKYLVVAIAAGGLLGVLFSVILLRMFRNGP